MKAEQYYAELREEIDRLHALLHDEGGWLMHSWQEAVQASLVRLDRVIAGLEGKR